MTRQIHPTRLNEPRPRNLSSSEFTVLPLREGPPSFSLTRSDLRRAERHRRVPEPLRMFSKAAGPRRSPSAPSN